MELEIPRYVEVLRGLGDHAEGRLASKFRDLVAGGSVVVTFAVAGATTGEQREQPSCHVHLARTTIAHSGRSRHTTFAGEGFDRAAG
jgi:hypothetical protein